MTYVTVWTAFCGALWWRNEYFGVGVNDGGMSAIWAEIISGSVVERGGRYMGEWQFFAFHGCGEKWQFCVRGEG